MTNSFFQASQTLQNDFVSSQLYASGAVAVSQLSLDTCSIDPQVQKPKKNILSECTHWASFIGSWKFF